MYVGALLETKKKSVGALVCIVTKSAPGAKGNPNGAQLALGAKAHPLAVHPITWESDKLGNPHSPPKLRGWLYRSPPCHGHYIENQ